VDNLAQLRESAINRLNQLPPQRLVAKVMWWRPRNMSASRPNWKPRAAPHPRHRCTACRRRLAEAEAPRQFLHRLHRNPLGTIHRLVKQHAARRSALTSSTGLPPPRS